MAAPTMPAFSISPEKEGSKLQYLKRQLLTTPPIISKDIDLRGKTAIVTGANRGIGLACARQLLELGLSKLIITGRDEARCQEAVKSLSEGREPGQHEISAWNLDLLAYDSVTAFAERSARELPVIDIVILNAGLFRQNMHINESTGHEEDVQTNYLSTMLLLLLFVRIFASRKASTVGEASPSPPRITVVSTDTAAWAQFQQQSSPSILAALDDANAPGFKWDMMERYGTSKLLGQLFVTELVKRVKPTLAITNLANPGMCHGSGLTRDGKGTWTGRFADGAFRLIGRSPEVGMRALVDAAVVKGVESHGMYVEDGEIRP